MRRVVDRPFQQPASCRVVRLGRAAIIRDQRVREEIAGLRLAAGIEIRGPLQEALADLAGGVRMRDAGRCEEKERAEKARPKGCDVAQGKAFCWKAVGSTLLLIGFSVRR